MLPDNSHYHSTLANYFSALPLFFDSDLQKKPNIRKCVELPYQQTKSELWDEVTDTLCNLDFIQAKVSSKMTNDLLVDFTSVLQKIPDNIEDLKREEEYSRRSHKYLNDLIKYSKGNLFTVEVPDSYSINQINKYGASNLDPKSPRLLKIKEFFHFVNSEAVLLNKYYNLSNFPIQHAANFNKGGYLENASKHYFELIKQPLILVDDTFKKKYIPESLFIKRLNNNESSDLKINIDGTIAISKYICRIDIWDLKNGYSSPYLNTQLSESDSQIFSFDYRKVLYKKKAKSNFHEIGECNEDQLVIADVLEERKIALLKSPQHIGQMTASPNLENVFFSTTKDNSNNYLMIWDYSNKGNRKMAEITGNIKWMVNSFNNKILLVVSQSSYKMPEQELAAKTESKRKEIHQRSLQLIKEKKANTSEYFHLRQQEKNLSISSYNWHIHLWDIKTLKKEISSPLDNPVEEIYLSSDGKKCLIVFPDEIVIKSLNDWNTLGKINYRGSLISAIKFSFNWEFAFWIENKRTIHIWDINKACILKSYKSDVNISDIHITHDGKMYIAVHEKSNETFRSNSDTIIVSVISDSIIKKIENLHITDISYDGRYGICSEGLLNIQDFIQEPDLGAVDTILNVSSINPFCTTALSAGNNGDLYLIDLERRNKKVMKDLTENKRPVYHISWYYNSDYALLSSDDNKKYLFDNGKKKVANTYNGSRYPDYSIYFKSGRYFASIIDENIIAVRNVSDGKIVEQVTANSHLHQLKISPDEREVYSIMSKRLVCFDFVKRSSLFPFDEYTCELEDFDISPDGQILASIAEDNTLQFWSVNKQKLFDKIVLSGKKETYSNYRGTGCKIQFLPDRTHILIAGYDNTIQLWHLRQKVCICLIADSRPLGSISNLAKGFHFISGLKHIIKYNIVNLKLDLCLTTVTKFWNYKNNSLEDEYKFQCPLCSEINQASFTILNTIKETIKKNILLNLFPENYLLPDEAWEDPALLGNCPECGGELKFNPFIAGGDY